MGCKAQESAQEPAVTELTLLDVARIETVYHHLWLSLSFVDLFGAQPVNFRDRVFRRLHIIDVKRLLISGELRVTIWLSRLHKLLLDLLDKHAGFILSRHLHDLLLFAVLLSVLVVLHAVLIVLLARLDRDAIVLQVILRTMLVISLDEIEWQLLT